MEFNIGRLLIFLLFVLLAIPVPFSLFTIPFSLISMGGTHKVWTVKIILPTITMILAGTYCITYIVSLIISLKAKRLLLLSFLPIAHIVLFALLLSLALWLEKKSG